MTHLAEKPHTTHCLLDDQSSVDCMPCPCPQQSAISSAFSCVPGRSLLLQLAAVWLPKTRTAIEHIKHNYNYNCNLVPISAIHWHSVFSSFNQSASHKPKLSQNSYLKLSIITVYNTAQHSSNNLPLILQTIMTVQILSIGRRQLITTFVLDTLWNSYTYFSISS